jgi:hypothetical protein
MRPNCITLHLVSSGGLYGWELENGDRRIEVRASGQARPNNAYLTSMPAAFRR